MIASADTHTGLWYLKDDARVSVASGGFIGQAAVAGKQIVVSSISLAEIVYLIEKNRLPANAYADLNPWPYVNSCLTNPLSFFALSPQPPTRQFP